MCNNRCVESPALRADGIAHPTGRKEGKMKMELDLQLFAEGAAPGGAAQGAAGGAQAAAPMATGQETQAEDNLPHLQPRRRKENPLEHMQFGVQPEQQQAAKEQAPEKQSFRDLIKGEYAKDAQAWLNETMADRFKAQGEMKRQLQQQQGLMDKMARKYGLKAGDMAGLSKALEEDDSVYAQGAAEAGMPVNAFKELEQAKEERDRLRQEKAEAERETQFRAHFEDLRTQAAELQKQFPQFDLAQELQNPKFLQMTSPEMGISVQDAYFALHAQELQRQGMAYAGQEAARALASSVRAGALRPLENGIQGGGAVQAVTDVTKLTRAQRDEINRRARAGMRIQF